MNKKQIKERIQTILENDDHAVYIAILHIYNNQTAEEQQSENTTQLNGIGFSAFDAPIMTSFAKFIERTGKLTERQMPIARRIIKKYHGQLVNVIDISDNKKEELQLTIPLVPKQQVEMSNKKIPTQVEKSVDGRYIRVKCPYRDFETRDKLNELGFKWKGDKQYWQAKDNAIRRIALDMELPDFTTSTEPQTYDFLRPYQVDDLNRMCKTPCILNANDMGLGKTLETLLTIKESCSEQKVLIVILKSLALGWLDELKKWNLYEDGNTILISGTPKQKILQIEMARSPKVKFVIATYDTVSGKMKKEKGASRKKFTPNQYLLALSEIQFDAIIADEAHAIKTRDIGRTNGIKYLSAPRRIALTGTPVQNRPEDLWSILHWINPFYSGDSYWFFVYRYCEVEESEYGTKPKGLTKDKDRVIELQKLLDQVMIRHSKTEVLKDLPDRITRDIKIKLAPKQLTMYKRVKKEILIELENADNVTISSALVRLLRLQQVTSCPEQYEITQNPKQDAALDIIKGTDEKVLVFCKFKSTVKSLQERLDKEKIKYATLTGDLTSKERMAQIDLFKKCPEFKVFIGTIQAASTGLNLTESSVTIFMDKAYSPALNQQARDRNYRIGQDKVVREYSIIAEGTIDEYVESLLDKKVADISQLLK